MSTLTLYADTTDDWTLVDINTTYNPTVIECAPGSGWATQGAGRLAMMVSQNPGYFRLCQSFLRFNTSLIPTGSVVTSSVMSLVTDGTIDSTSRYAEAYLYNWGGTVTAADTRKSSEINALPLVAKRQLTSLSTNTRYDWTDVALTSNLVRDGYTYLVCTEDYYRLAEQPTTNHWTSFKDANNTGTTDDPMLVITFTQASPSSIVVDASDADITSGGNGYTYSDTRAGSNLTVYGGVGSTSHVAGQETWSNGFFIIQSLLGFDFTQFWEDHPTAVISAASLNVTLFSAYHGSGKTFQARLHDWGTTATTGDYVAGADLSSKTLLAHWLHDGSGSGEKTFIDDALVANIPTGFLRMVIVGKDTVDNTAAAMDKSEYLGFYSSDETTGAYRPRIVLTWSLPSGPTNLQTYNIYAKAIIATINGNPIANVQSINGNF